MRIELVTQPKYRDSARLGDDVVLLLPGAVAAVFDGATDPKGTIVNGSGAGRFAAQCVASLSATLFADPDNRRLPLTEMITVLARGLARATDPLGLEIRPSTTLALALDLGDAWRLVILGDSGIRLNGSRVLVHHKKVDEVSTQARVALFHHLATRFDDKDTLELAVRRAIFLGLDLAMADGVIQQQDADAIVAQAVRATETADHADTVRVFLRGGIRTQHLHGNTTGDPFSFDTMNGTEPTFAKIIDETHAKADVHTIEIFSDGYLTLPEATDAAAWEAAFRQAEAEDFHNIGRHATVKGATSAEHFDDRTLVSLTL